MTSMHAPVQPAAVLAHAPGGLPLLTRLSACVGAVFASLATLTAATAFAADPVVHRAATGTNGDIGSVVSVERCHAAAASADARIVVCGRRSG